MFSQAEHLVNKCFTSHQCVPGEGPSGEGKDKPGLAKSLGNRKMRRGGLKLSLGARGAGHEDLYGRVALPVQAWVGLAAGLCQGQTCRPSSVRSKC